MTFSPGSEAFGPIGNKALDQMLELLRDREIMDDEYNISRTDDVSFDLANDNSANSALRFKFAQFPDQKKISEAKRTPPEPSAHSFRKTARTPPPQSRTSAQLQVPQNNARTDQNLLPPQEQVLHIESSRSNVLSLPGSEMEAEILSIKNKKLPAFSQVSIQNSYQSENTFNARSHRKDQDLHISTNESNLSTTFISNNRVPAMNQPQVMPVPVPVMVPYYPYDPYMNAPAPMQMPMPVPMMMPTPEMYQPQAYGYPAYPMPYEPQMRMPYLPSPQQQQKQKPQRQSQPQPPQPPQGPKAVLYVKNIPSKCHSKDVTKIFSAYGRVLSATTCTPQRASNSKKYNTAFVVYGTTQEADDAIRGLHEKFSVDVGCRPLFVNYGLRTEVISQFGYDHCTKLYQENPENPKPTLMPKPQ